MTENDDSTFRDLSILLQQQIDALVSLQTLVIAIHKSLANLNPQFEETCKGVLESLTRMSHQGGGNLRKRRGQVREARFRYTVAAGRQRGEQAC